MKQTNASKWQKKIVAFVKANGIVRPRDIEKHGMPREYLRRLHKQGVLEQVGRGLYAIPESLTSESRQLAEIAKRIPGSVVCLLSALQFHNLTTQLPHETWIAIQSPGWKPRLRYPPIRVVWLSGKAYSYGIEQHLIDNVPVKVYGVAKTVADCFKFRNKIGLDVALEALQEARRNRRVTTDDLWEAAKACRASNIMRPYMEAIT